MGRAWKIRVEGEEEAHWLRQQLVARQLDCSVPSRLPGGPMHVFLCRPQEHHAPQFAERTLREIPQVRIQIAPA